MTFRFLPLSALFVAASLADGCSDDGKPCDPDQILKDRVCVPMPVPEAGTDAEVVDVEVIDGEITDAAGDRPAVGEFGRMCTMAGDSAECAAPAPYCAVQPGTMMGYCTATGCKADPTICPSGWTCFDVTVVNFCFKPLAP